MDYDDNYFFEVYKKIIEEESEIPSIDDRWNACISEISKFNHVHVASFITPAMDISEIHMMIIVQPSTTRQDIIDDWKEISDYRDSLLRLYGILKNFKLKYRQKVSRLNSDFGMGYGTIAKFLNYQLILLFLSQESAEMNPQLDFPANYEQVFLEHLVAFGYSENDAKEYYNLVQADIQEGRFPWHYRHGPFDSMRIRNNLREFTKEQGLGWLETKLQYLDDYLFENNIEIIARQCFEKSFKINRSDERFFREVQEVKSRIKDEVLENLKDLIFPEPPDMSKFNYLLP